MIFHGALAYTKGLADLAITIAIGDESQWHRGKTILAFRRFDSGRPLFCLRIDSTRRVLASRALNLVHLAGNWCLKNGNAEEQASGLAVKPHVKQQVSEGMKSATALSQPVAVEPGCRFA